MKMFQRFNHQTMPLIGVLLLCLSHITHANDLENADKLYRQGLYEQALNKANTYLANKPKSAQARFLKGLIFTELGKTADAISMFSTLIEDYPELPEPYNNLAVLYANEGQYDKAKLSLEMAIRTHPSYSTAHENLGDIYAKMASQAYDRALQLDRGNVGTKTKLAMIQELFVGNKRRNELDSDNDSAPAVFSQAPTKPKISATATATSNETAATPGKILNTVNAWATAWSAQNVEEYLSFYADNFKTNGGESFASWKATRRERLSNPKSIQVSIEKATVKLADSNHATVNFRQIYKASHLKATGKKMLLMVKSGEKWLIQEERFQ